MNSHDNCSQDAAHTLPARAAGSQCVPAFEAPHLVTRGETHLADSKVSQHTAFIDWFAFTIKLPTGQGLSWLKQAISTTFCVPAGNWKGTGKGWNGYSKRIDLEHEGTNYGLIAYGGDNQRGTLHVELNAHACRLIQDWNAVRLWGETYEASITRVDLAHDDLEAQQVSIADALQWLKHGEFNGNGRPPAAQLYDDLGSNKGKTLYIGQRTSGKMLRIYEKGKELGDPTSQWVRVEAELRNKGRAIPWDVVLVPGHYLSGAYPALKFLSTEQQRIRTIQRGGQISYDVMVKNLRTVGGKALNVMCSVHQGDAIAVVSQVVREGIPKRLAGYADALNVLDASKQ